MEKFRPDNYVKPTEKEYRDSRYLDEPYISPDYNAEMERLVDPEIKKKVLREEEDRERNSQSWYGNIEI